MEKSGLKRVTLGLNCLELVQGDLNKILKASDGGDSLLDEVELLGLDIVTAGLDMLGKERVILLADADNF